MAEYVETGGLRWGEAFWRAANASWPFATIQISEERVRLRVKFWKVWDVTFDLEKTELHAIRIRRGLVNVGLLFEHHKDACPPFLLFWTFKQRTLVSELRQRGYTVQETSPPGITDGRA